MKKTFLALSCLLFYATTFAQTPTQAVNPDPHWAHQWTNDFNTINWRINTSGSSAVLEQDFGTYWWGNWIVANDFKRELEPQTFIHNNATLNSEGLVLTAKHVVPNYLGRQYTSASVSSWGSGLVKYGYLEARIKVSDIYGLWPAFWLWNSDKTDSLPNQNFHEEEIDIFEMIPGHVVGTEEENISGSSEVVTNPYVGQTFDKSLMTSNLHKFNPSYDNNVSASPNPNPSSDPNRYHKGLVTKLPNSIYYTDYILYAVEWSPSKITYFVNGIIIKEDPNPFDVNLDKSIILNLSLSPWVSQYNPSHPYYGTPYNDNIDSAYFTPVNNYSNQASINNTDAEMVIDYVKFYKLDMSECSTKIESYNTASGGGINDIDTYNNKVKKSITVSGNVSLDVSSPKTLRASEYILLDEGFDSNNQVLYIDVNNCY